MNTSDKEQTVYSIKAAEQTAISSKTTDITTYTDGDHSFVFSSGLRVDGNVARFNLGGKLGVSKGVFSNYCKFDVKNAGAKVTVKFYSGTADRKNILVKTSKTKIEADYTGEVATTADSSAATILEETFTIKEAGEYYLGSDNGGSIYWTEISIDEHPEN